MSKDVIVAIVDGASVRAFHRDGQGGSVDQVAQFLGGAEPAELAAILADLGDRFGWDGRSQPAASGATAREVSANPPAPGAALPPAAPTKGRPTSAPVREDAAKLLEYIAAHPGCTRAAIARAFWPGKDPHAPTTHTFLATRLRQLDGALRIEGKQPMRYYAT